MHGQGAHAIRNVAIVAHVDHGKTTLSDALLLKAGLLHKDRAGDQNKGRSLDTLQDEKERGITIKSAAITLDLTADARALVHGRAGLALAEACNNASQATEDAAKEEIVNVYMDKLPSSVKTTEQLREALQKQGVTISKDEATIKVNAHRHYATVSVRQRLADRLTGIESMDMDGLSVPIELAGSNGMSRLKAYCETHKMDMPMVSVREVKDEQNGHNAFRGLATWDALGGVLIQAADVHSTQSNARQAVAEECLRFASKQGSDHENGQETKTEPSDSSDESNAESSSEELEEFDLQTDKVPFRLNLIDSPGHLDFNAEVTSALRICDGALVVVDAIEGKAVQTDNVLMQALKEGVRPVLMINKVDRLIMEKQFEPEEIYDAMMRVVDQVNTFIEAHQLDHLPDQRVRFEDGSICFGSGYFGWSCSVDTFITKDCPLGKYVPTRNALVKKDNFVRNIIQPIVRLHRLCGVLPTKKEVPAPERLRSVSALLKNAGKTAAAKIKEEEAEQPRKLLKKVMMAWLPAADALANMIASALPSPVEAQASRAPLLYTGDIEDTCGQGITGCDPTGPAVVYVSKMAPSTEGKKNMVAYGRVFSGEIMVGDSLYTLQGGSSPAQATITKIMQCGLGGKMHALRAAQAGQLVALEGVDKALHKAGTLCSDKSASPIKHMRFSVTPVVQHSIRPTDSKQLTRMVLEMNRVVNADSTAMFFKDNDTGEYILAGAGALHIEILVSQLFQNSKIEVQLSEPRVNYRETVQSESSLIALAKSDNKHNRIWMKASRLSDPLVEQMADGDLQWLDVKSLGKKLSSEYGWDSSEASRIWAVGPEPSSESDQPTCLLVDSTFGMQIPDDAKSNIVNAFMQVVSQGVLVGSPLHGVRFDLMDAKFHQDSVHRRPNSIVPATSRAMKGAFLYADPALLEPVFRAVVTGAPGTVNSAFSVLGNRAGQIVDTSVSEAGDVIEALLPVRRSFGLFDQLYGESKGHALCSLSFEGVQLVPESEQDAIIAETRQQKNMSADVPSASHFVDKL